MKARFRARQQWLAAAALLGWLLLGLACNYPSGANAPVSEEALRQTLAARRGAGLPETPTAPSASHTPTNLPVTEGPASSKPLPGLSTATPGPPGPNHPPYALRTSTPYTYIAQSGDTILALAQRFAVAPQDISSQDPLPASGLINPGQRLTIPNTLGEPLYPSALLPDSEVVFSPSTVGFSVQDYASQAGGYLNSYAEWVNGDQLTGAEIVQRVAENTSTNPRLLLALLEQRAGWVRGQPLPAANPDYPLGIHSASQKGLYYELAAAANLLGAGYYGWREGSVTELKFKDVKTARLSPALNAGSVAVQYLYGRLYKQDAWLEALYGTQGFVEAYTEMFGDPWGRAAAVEPLLPAGLAQPRLELPFAPGLRWSLTGGPHRSWNAGSASGALDFSPVTGEEECAISKRWVTAAAPGVATRSGHNIVAIDLDGDGYEQTGWIVFYFHIADDADRIPAGVRVTQDEPLGHPSCEGGSSTGTHVHIARKYNGEWIAADEPLPFILSGWQAHRGTYPYEGSLTRGDQVVDANPGGPYTSIIVR